MSDENSNLKQEYARFTELWQHGNSSLVNYILSYDMTDLDQSLEEGKEADRAKQSKALREEIVKLILGEEIKSPDLQWVVGSTCLFQSSLGPANINKIIKEHKFPCGIEWVLFPINRYDGDLENADNIMSNELAALITKYRTGS